MDISLGDGSGPRAANFVRQQMAAYAPLAPLVLTLKVFLRAAGLNEVANGGLSSFSLTNMVLAHLQEDLKAGQDIYDLGESLYGFFCRWVDGSLHGVGVRCWVWVCVGHGFVAGQRRMYTCPHKP